MLLTYEVFGVDPTRVTRDARRAKQTCVVAVTAAHLATCEYRRHLLGAGSIRLFGNLKLRIIAEYPTG